MPAGSVSLTVTLSASARPGPVLLRTVMTKSKSSRMLTGSTEATLLATSTSARVRTVVGLVVGVVQQDRCRSRPRPRPRRPLTVFYEGAFRLASHVTVKVVLAPGSSRGSVQISVPPKESTPGTVEQAPPVPVGTVFDWIAEPRAGQRVGDDEVLGRRGPLLSTRIV
jgi:hypothetical protein